MKPYYEHAGITIYRGDCREILPTLDPSLTIISDPPYGIGYVHGAEPNDPHASRFNGVPVAGDDQPFDPSHLLKFRSLLVWGANHYADQLPVRDGRWLVWDKRCGTGGNDLSDCEIAWCRGSNGKAARMFRLLWNGFAKQTERGIPRDHPTQKPISLMTWCLSFLPTGGGIGPLHGQRDYARGC